MLQKGIDLWHIVAHIVQMPITAKHRKSDRLVARVTPQDKALLERAAVLEGCSVGRFVVLHVRAAAEKVVQEHETIRLNKEESRRLVQALLAPPRPPTKAFQRALKLYRESVISDVNPGSPAIRPA